jgi:isopentenyldiphosphate isomerase
MPAPAPTAAVDVVDERNEPIGTAQRREVLPQGLNFRTVHNLVADEHGNVLLQRLGTDRDRHPLKWGSSVAGYLHAGETYEAAAKRRFEEELGIQAPLEFVGITPMHDECSTKFIGVFLAAVPHDLPEIRDSKHIDSLRWVPLSELLDQVATKPDAFTPSLIHVINFLTGTDGTRAAR